MCDDGEMSEGKNQVQGSSGLIALDNLVHPTLAVFHNQRMQS